MSVLNNHDHELIERDTALPGLRHVLDPERLLHEFGDRHFEQSELSRLKDIRLDYVRYKPGMNCLGRYAFTLDGQPRQAYVKAFGPDAARKLSKAAELAGASGPFGPGRVVLPATGLLFSFFPNDAKLRSIARLADITNRQHLVSRIFNQDDAWRSAKYSVLNYKPERRLVCRFERPDGHCSTVKFYTERGFARTLHYRRRRVFRGYFPVPGRLGESRKHCVHAFEWLPGSPLREWSLDPGSDVTVFHEAGKLLAGLHASDVAGLESSEEIDLPSSINALAGMLSFILPEISSAAGELANTLAQFALHIRNESCPVHADFYDKQLIVGPESLRVIDLDRARVGTAAEDLGCFIAHLERLAIKDERLDEKRTLLLSQTLLEGYRAAGGHYDESELTGWIALSLFQLSHSPFRDRALNWPGQIRKILHRVRSLLTAAGPEAVRGYA